MKSISHISHRRATEDPEQRIGSRGKTEPQPYEASTTSHGRDPMSQQAGSGEPTSVLRVECAASVARVLSPPCDHDADGAGINAAPACDQCAVARSIPSLAVCALSGSDGSWTPFFCKCGRQELGSRVAHAPKRSTRPPGLGSPLATSAPGLGSPLPHLRRDRARPCAARTHDIRNRQ